MGKFGKVVIVVIMLIYILSPVDVTPGPIDDVLVGLLGIAMTKKIGNND